MKIITFEIAQMGENCYLIATEEGNAAVIDPGGEANRILRYAEQNGFKIQKILLTHGHFDHILGVKELKDATAAKLYIHEADAVMLASGEENLASYFGAEYLPVTPDHTLVDGETITLDELCFTVLHTPGHTPGSVCYQLGQTLFTGDTLFAGSIGRTDFPKSSPLAMMQSLRKLTALTADYKILSGHGDPTTLSWERDHNPYISR